MKQADLGLNLTTKRTRKREFLAQMDRVVSLAASVALVAPHAPAGKTGRPPFALETMLRIHFRPTATFRSAGWHTSRTWRTLYKEALSDTWILARASCSRTHRAGPFRPTARPLTEFHGDNVMRILYASQRPPYPFLLGGAMALAAGSTDDAVTPVRPLPRPLV